MTGLVFDPFDPAQTQDQWETLRELRRVLRPEGTLHLLDFGPPHGRLSRAAAHLLHRAGHVHEDLEGRIPSLLAQAGFLHAEEVDHRGTFVGSLSYYRAVNPRP